MTVHECLQQILPHENRSQAIFEQAQDLSQRAVSPRQLWQDVEELSHQLSAWGIGARQLIPLFLQNSIEYIEFFLALLSIRAVPVIAQMDYRKLELDEIFANAQPAAVIAEEQHIEILRPYLKDKRVIVRRNNQFRLIQDGGDRPRSAEVPEETGCIHYTYRGCGYPLGALVPHAQYLRGAHLFQKSVQFEKSSTLLSVLPFSHLFSLVGCILLSLLFGVRLIITRSFSPRIVFNLMREQRINYLISVPDILLLLARLIDQETSFPSLQAMVSGGSLLCLEDQLCIERAFGVELLNGYGLTEFTPITGNSRGQSKKGSIGLPCKSLEVALHDGEICLRTEAMTKAYYRRPEQTREAVRGGWFHTGDLAHYDGSYLVFDREKKETRKVHGSMVDLNEVRRAIALIDPGLEAKVDFQGGSLLAGLGLLASVDLAEKAIELRQGLKQLIAAYKIPKNFCRLQDYPPGGSETCP
jgi:long-chain acyl-CoA synthetase